MLSWRNWGTKDSGNLNQWTWSHFFFFHCGVLEIRLLRSGRWGLQNFWGVEQNGVTRIIFITLQLAPSGCCRWTQSTFLSHPMVRRTSPTLWKELNDLEKALDDNYFYKVDFLFLCFYFILFFLLGFCQNSQNVFLAKFFGEINPFSLIPQKTHTNFYWMHFTCQRIYNQKQVVRGKKGVLR